MARMTYQMVKKRVAEIAALAGDDEIAHSAEDDLYREVLQSIAEGLAHMPEACAREALKTQALDFARYHA